jgi:hypothetical protein
MASNCETRVRVPPLFQRGQFSKGVRAKNQQDYLDAMGSETSISLSPLYMFSMALP